MQLTELHPEFLGAGGHGVSQPSDRACPVCQGAGCDDCHSTGKEYEPAPRREGVGLLFDCPCGCESQCFVGFANPLDGGPPHDPRAGAQWQRTGDTFETLTLTPSILRSKEKGGCGWHGFITNGGIVTA